MAWRLTIVHSIDGAGNVARNPFLRHAHPEELTGGRIVLYESGGPTWWRPRLSGANTGHPAMDRRGSQAWFNRDRGTVRLIASHDLQEPLRAVGGLCQTAATRFRKHGRQGLEYIHGAAEAPAAWSGSSPRSARLFARGHSWRGFLPRRLWNAILKETLRNLQTSIESTQAKSPTMSCRTLPVDATQIISSPNLNGNADQIPWAAARRRSMWRPQAAGPLGLLGSGPTGLGIEPAVLSDRIFQIFQRLDTRKYYPGTGIGWRLQENGRAPRPGAIWVRGPSRGKARLCGFYWRRLSAIKHKLSMTTVQ